MTTTAPSAARPLSYGSIVLFSLVTIVALIGVPAYGLLYGYAALDWVLFSTLYAVTGLGITVGYHRLIAHRSFVCPNWVKGALLIAGGWALQNSALKWGADHLRHHARCDEDEDPYNANRGFWYSHCGWVFFKSRMPEQKYLARLQRDPVIMWQHRFYVPIVLSGLALPFVVGLVVNGWTGAVSCFLLAGVARTFWVLNSTFCINSICHMFGSQPCGAIDSSRNAWWISFVTFGEGYHNYHHNAPRDYRNGPRWYDFDPSKWVIFALSRLSLATALRRAPLVSARRSDTIPQTGF